MHDTKKVMSKQVMEQSRFGNADLLEGWETLRVNNNNKLNKHRRIDAVPETDAAPEI